MRYVSLGAGCCLTDFEILCRLSVSGFEIESVVLIDSTYGASCQQTEPSCLEKAVWQLANFFPSASVHTYTSVDVFKQAVQAHPLLYGHANVFVHCDAVDAEDTFKEAAIAALDRGFYAYVLSNEGLAQGVRPHLERFLPESLWAAHRKGYQVSKYQRPRVMPGLIAEYDSLISTKFTNPICERAGEWLEHRARERAIEAKLRMFRVTPLHGVGLRSEPSESGAIIGGRKQGQEVIARQVVGEWAQLSELDTYFGYTMQYSPQFKEGAGAWLHMTEGSVEEVLLDEDQIDLEFFM